MDYAEINAAILGDRDIDERKVVKNDTFYAYLLNNKVAFYYAKFLSKATTPYEKNLLQRLEVFEERYHKSLEVLARVCRSNNISFLLYKTHKFIPEAVDGDIDIMVHERDFWPLMKALSKVGFAVEEDEPGKGKCVKEGYCVIEPHTNVSWRGGTYVKPEMIWRKPLSVSSEGLDIRNVSAEVEVMAILAKILFEPSYLDLYSLKLLNYFYEQGVDDQLILKMTTRPQLTRPLLKFSQNYINMPSRQRFPVFLPAYLYVKLWTKNLWQSRDIRIYFLHLSYFFYWKARYRVNGRLPFTHHHEWKV